MGKCSLTSLLKDIVFFCLFLEAYGSFPGLLKNCAELKQTPSEVKVQTLVHCAKAIYFFFKQLFFLKKNYASFIIKIVK